MKTITYRSEPCFGKLRTNKPLTSRRRVAAKRWLLRSMWRKERAVVQVASIRLESRPDRGFVFIYARAFPDVYFSEHITPLGKSVQPVIEFPVVEPVRVIP